MAPPRGFKRSRALWDHARVTAAASSTTAGRFPSLETLKSYGRAILYEIQPVRWQQLTATRQETAENLQVFLQASRVFVVETLPSTSKQVYQFLQTVTWRQWMIVLSILAYYVMLRVVHTALDAGPFVLIITALVLIFTIGLGDRSEDDNSLSAYSVFNRGFQRLLGSVDQEALLAQHVGGGAFMAAAALGGGAAMQEDDFQNRPPAAARDENLRRRGAAAAAGGNPPPNPGQQQQPQNHAANNLNDEEDDNGEEGDNDGSDNDQDENNNPARGQQRGGGGGGRRSGKKARRRNLDQRREIRRQREAAVAMGFGNPDAAEDAMARNRLVEDQAAAAAARAE